jgi:hypothetical protein
MGTELLIDLWESETDLVFASTIPRGLLKSIGFQNMSRKVATICISRVTPTKNIYLVTQCPCKSATMSDPHFLLQFISSC